MALIIIIISLLLSLPTIVKADVQECIAGSDCYLLYVPSNKTDSNSPITDLSESTADFYYLWNDNGTTGTQLTESTPDIINLYQIGTTGIYKLYIPSSANIVTSGNAGKTLCVYVSGYSNITTNRAACVYVKTKTDENTVARMPSSGTLPITTTGVTLADDAITAAKIAAGAITASESPALGDLKWGTYEVVDLTNEGGDANPTVTSFDTNLTWTSNFTNTTPQPIIYFPTTTEESTQNSNCGVQGMRTTATNYNTTTKVVTVNTLPLAPDYRCVFRIY